MPFLRVDDGGGFADEIEFRIRGLGFPRRWICENIGHMKKIVKRKIVKTNPGGGGGGVGGGFNEVGHVKKLQTSTYILDFLGSK